MGAPPSRMGAPCVKLGEGTAGRFESAFPNQLKLGRVAGRLFGGGGGLRLSRTVRQLPSHAQHIWLLGFASRPATPPQEIAGLRPLAQAREGRDIS